jgi:hypothetical protein
MDKFLKMLIYHTNTLDGKRNSAEQLKLLIVNQRVIERSLKSAHKQRVIRKEVDHLIMYRTVLIYKLIRIR